MIKSFTRKASPEQECKVMSSSLVSNFLGNNTEKLNSIVSYLEGSTDLDIEDILCSFFQRITDQKQFNEHDLSTLKEIVDRALQNYSQLKEDLGFWSFIVRLNPYYILLAPVNRELASIVLTNNHILFKPWFKQQTETVKKLLIEHFNKLNVKLAGDASLKVFAYSAEENLASQLYQYIDTNTCKKADSLIKLIKEDPKLQTENIALILAHKLCCRSWKSTDLYNTAHILIDLLPFNDSSFIWDDLVDLSPFFIGIHPSLINNPQDIKRLIDKRASPFKSFIEELRPEVKEQFISHLQKNKIQIEDLYQHQEDVVQGFCSISKQVLARHWTDKELQILKKVYLEARKKKIPHNQIYLRLQEYLPHSARGIKQKLEALYSVDDDLSSFKYEHWDREKIIEEIVKLYSNGDPISRKLLPPRLEYQITNHSLPKAITRGFEVYFDSFDHAIAEAILQVGKQRQDGKLIEDKPIKTIEEAWFYYRTNEKLNNPWIKDEIITLFKKAHEQGLPLTKSFFTAHANIYIPLLGISRSLDGLRKSIERLGLTWGDLVMEAVPDYVQWYDESGKSRVSMGELRVMRFLDLKGIPYRKATRADKIPVVEPDLIEAGYVNFVPDLFLTKDGQDIALVEVYGAIADSGAASGELSQKYREKVLAKDKVYKNLPMPYIAIHDNVLNGSDLTNEKLEEKFKQFLPDIDAE